jgi:hypothetical protein
MRLLNGNDDTLGDGAWAWFYRMNLVKLANRAASKHPQTRLRGAYETAP